MDSQTQPATEPKTKIPAKTRPWLIVLASSLLVVAIVFLGKWSLNTHCLSIAEKRMSRFEYTEALKCLEFCENWGIDNFETHFLKARIHRKTGREKEFFESLLESLDMGLPKSRRDNEELLFKAQSGTLSELFSELENLAGGVNQFDPQEIYEAMVNGCFLQSRLNEANNYLENWKQDFPGDPRQRFYQAALLIHFGPTRQIAGAQDQAAEILQELIKENPKHYQAVMTYGDLLFATNQIEAAANQFENCIDHPDAGIQPTLSLAKCYANLGRLKEAKDLFKSVLDKNPEDHFARAELGKLQFNDEEYEEALKNLEASFPNRKWDFDLANTLARTLEVFGKQDRARELFAHSNRIRENLAIVQDLKEDVDLENNEEKRFKLAKMLFEFGNPKDAMIYLNSVLESNPKHAGARELKEKLEAQKSKRNPWLPLYVDPKQKQ